MTTDTLSHKIAIDKCEVLADIEQDDIGQKVLPFEQRVSRHLV
jgi:hypothetical protein